MNGLSELMDGCARAGSTLLFAAVTLPFVAWLEGRRGREVARVVTGPRGAWTALATALKLLGKRAPRSMGSDRLLHVAAPVLAIIPALALPALLPQSANDPVRSTLPLVLALPVLSSAAIALAGFAGGSRLALLSALRLVLLRLSVIVVVGISAVASARLAGSVELVTVALSQAEPLAFGMPRYALLLAPTSFAAALCALAIHAQHVVRARTEASLHESWLGEATGPVLLGHRIFESLDLLAGAALLAALFLGGPHPTLTFAPAPLVFWGKALFCVVLIIIARDALPRTPLAAAVRFAWLVLVPLTLTGVLAIAIGPLLVG